jgi:coenzyme F420-reducing hydrogenase delta subunit
VRILCSSRFDSGLALESLAGGCQGVLVVGCLRGGGQHAPNDPILARRENELRDLMDLLGLPASRLGVVRAAPGAEGEALTEGVRAFIDGLGDGLYDGPGGEA